LAFAAAAGARDHPGMDADDPTRDLPRRLDPNERRRLPRVHMAVECTLQRRMGSPITAQTIDLGPGGMRVTSRRPLTADEELDFAIPTDEVQLSGRARVMRQQDRYVYALRFERLPPEARAALNALAAAKPPTSIL
jgi:c-di-GMP-binding flagellar brake protein YcgR